MREIIGSFLSNDSRFGKLITKIGIIIGANLMFVLFSLPVFTTGAAFTGLHTVMLKTLRGDGVVNPFKQFWIGFKTNFKQATITWILFLFLIAFGYWDVSICRQATGFMNTMQYPLYAVGVILVILIIYLYPTMAAFENTIPNLLRNGIYFAFHRPWTLPIILFFQIFPLYLTYTDAQLRPLYAFIWFFFGFGAISMLTCRLLVKDFSKYLPVVDDCGDFILDENGDKIMPGSEAEARLMGVAEKTEDEVLEEMKLLDM